MKPLKNFVAVAFMFLSMSLFAGCDAYLYSTSQPQPRYDNPSWAPSYYDGARYYYLPDIECYYDIYAREFVYLYNGQWIYSQTLPPYYSDFDLNNSFVVVLNTNVYNPWMHHQYYVSHFPRYYYRDYYDRSNIPYVRGFNENNRSAIYWSENERNRARNWNGENLRNNRRFSYSREDLRHQMNMNNQRDYRQSRDNTNFQRQSNIEEKRRSDATNYYGRPIGQPVKTRKQMRNPNPAGTDDRNRDRDNSERNRGENSKDRDKQDRK